MALNVAGASVPFPGDSWGAEAVKFGEGSRPFDVPLQFHGPCWLLYCHHFLKPTFDVWDSLWGHSGPYPIVELGAAAGKSGCVGPVKVS